MKTPEEDSKFLVEEVKNLRVQVNTLLRGADSQRRQMQDLLRGSEEKLRFTVEAANLGTWEWDIATGMLSWSETLQNLHGMTPGSFSGTIEAFFEDVHPDDRTRVTETIAKALERGTRIEVEYRLNNKNDKLPRWVQGKGQILYNAKGRPARVLGMCMDVTDRKRAEEELRRGKIYLEQRVQERTAELALINQSLLKEIAERQQVEAALRASEERYRVLGEASAVGFWQISSEGHTLYVNPAMCALLEIDRAEELAGQTYHSFFTPESLETMRKEHLKRSEGIASTYEVVLRGKRGGLHDVLVSGGPLFSPAGELRSLIGTFIDITERKKAEEALRYHHHLLTAVIEGNSAGIFVKDRDGRFLMVNSTAARMVSKPVEEIIGKGDNHLFPPEITRLIRANDQEILKSGEARTYEEKIELANGETRSCLTTKAPYRNPRGEILGVMGISQDFTELRRAEVARQKAEDELRRVLASVSDCLWSGERDSEGRWRNRYISPIVEKIAGRPLDFFEEDQDRWFSIVHPEDQPLLRGALEQIESNSSSCELEYRVCLPDQSVRWVRDRIQISRLTEGRIRLDGVVSDITERKQLENELRQAQKMEAIGRIAGGVAHEFNNLLTVILGYTDLLIAQEEKEYPPLSILEEIKKSGERAAELTKQMLAFSRKQLLKPRVLDLNVVLRDVIKMVNRILGENIELASYLDPKLGYVKADPAQINQVVLNLTLNARDAMPHGGRLDFITSNIELTRDFTRSHPDVPPGQYVVLSVRDTGCGMDKETKTHLFEPFFTTKEVGKGTGLGLPSVYGIVKQSGGHIDVVSEEREGTCFHIYLPRVEKAARPQEEYRCEGVPIGSETILLVEDEKIVRAMVRTYLQSLGYRVLEACSSEQAHALAAEHQGIDLLLTDVIIPGTKGPVLYQQIVQSGRHLKVLYMSGYTGDVIGHMDRDTEAFFLQKPFAPDHLARKVRETLDR